MASNKTVLQEVITEFSGDNTKLKATLAENKRLVMQTLDETTSKSFFVKPDSLKNLSRDFQLQVGDMQSRLNKLGTSSGGGGVGAIDPIASKFFDGFSSGADHAGDMVEAFGSKVGGVFNALISPAALSALAIVGVADQFRRATLAAFEFDLAFTKTSVIMAVNGQNADTYKTALTGLSSALGPPSHLIETFNKALLDSGDPEVALRMTELAAKFAAVSGATPTAAVETLGALMDSLGIKADRGSEIFDLLFFTMRKGGGSVEELSAKLPQLTDIAGELGIGLNEISGTLVTLGEVAGASPQKNLASLQQLLQQLILNAGKFREKGIDVEGLIQTKGIQGALQAIVDGADGSAAKLREMGISGRTVGAILKLTGENAEKLAENINAAGNAAGETDRAMAAFAETPAGQVKKLSAEWEKFQLVIGQAFLPAVLGGLQLINTYLESQRRFWGSIADVVVRLTSSVQFDESKVSPGLEAVTLATRLFGEEVKGTNIELAALTKTESASATAAAEKMLAEKGITRDLVAKAKAIEAAAAAENKAIREGKKAAATEGPIGKVDKVADLKGETSAQEKARLERERIDRQLATDIETRRAERLQASIKFAADEAKLRTQSALDQNTIERRALEDVQMVEEEKYNIKRAALEKELALLAGRKEQDDETKNKQKALAGDIAKLDDEQAAKKQETAARLVQLEFQRAQQVRQIEQGLFDLRKALGETTVTEESARLTQIVNDTTRSEAERTAAVRSRAELMKQTEQSLFDLRRALGLTTLQDELARQQEIVNSTKAGTQERIKAETELANKQKQFRDANKSATEQLLDTLGKRIEERGGTVTQGSLNEEFKRFQEENKETLAQFSAGGPVVGGLEKIKSAFASTGIMDQVTNLGGDVGKILATGTAAAQQSIQKAGPRQPGPEDAAALARQEAMAQIYMDAQNAKLDRLDEKGVFLRDDDVSFGEALNAVGTAPPGMEQEQAKLNEVQASVGMLGKSYTDNYQAILTATDNFITQINAKLAEGNGKLATTVTDGVVNGVIKRLEQEALRQ